MRVWDAITTGEGAGVVVAGSAGESFGVVGDCAGELPDGAVAGGSGLAVEGSYTVDGEGEGGSSDGVETGSAGLGVVGSFGSVGDGAGGSFDDVYAGGSRL